MAQKGYVEIDKETCKGCNLCVIRCPTKCLTLNTSDTNSFGLHYSYLARPEDCIVREESLIQALEDTIPERHHHLIPLNKQAIDMGMGLVE